MLYLAAANADARAAFRMWCEPSCQAGALLLLIYDATVLLSLFQKKSRGASDF